MQQSVARLTKEITSLKASLDAANRSASNQIAKISERLNRETANVTGSVRRRITGSTNRTASGCAVRARRRCNAIATSVNRARLDDPRDS